MRSSSEGRGEARGGHSGSYYLAGAVIVISHGLPVDEPVFCFLGFFLCVCVLFCFLKNSLS